MADTVPSQTRSDVYAQITEKIAAAIEAGAGTFTMPWHVNAASPGFPVNALTGKSYRGVNVLALWVEGTRKGYQSASWATYRQWSQLGAHVRKGERGSTIVFFKQLEETAEDEDTQEDAHPRLVARASRVFNAAQVEGWEEEPEERPTQLESNLELEAFVRATEANIVTGSRACYRPATDTIEMPPPSSFVRTQTHTLTESYYSVLLHELTHWTGATHRLNRVFGKRFGDRTYAFEELIAELGSAFLCSALKISVEPRPDHAAYVASWLEILDSDRKAIFTAASKAQEAAEHLMRLAVGTIEA